MGVKPFPREGAFCVLDKKVGIIFEYPQINSAGSGESNVDQIDTQSAEVHFINEKGETTERVRNVPVGAISQAKLAQIPSKRRPTDAQAKKYGYK
jgi:hypothetical protein